jgi:hypothetical protein
MRLPHHQRTRERRSGKAKGDVAPLLPGNHDPGHNTLYVEGRSHLVRPILSSARTIKPTKRLRELQWAKQTCKRKNNSQHPKLDVLAVA